MIISYSVWRCGFWSICFQFQWTLMESIWQFTEYRVKINIQYQKGAAFIFQWIVNSVKRVYDRPNVVVQHTLTAYTSEYRILLHYHWIHLATLVEELTIPRYIEDTWKYRFFSALHSAFLSTFNQSLGAVSLVVRTGSPYAAATTCILWRFVRVRRTFVFESARF